MDQDFKTSREIAEADFSARFATALRANQAATDMFDEALTQFLGINRTDGRCIDIVDRLGRVTAGQLAQESGLTTGAVTAVVDRLEAVGYLRRARDPDDRRKVWIETTAEVGAINDRIFGHYARLQPKLMSKFTAEQLQGILAFLEMGALMNRELSGLLRENTDAGANTIAERLIQARAYERAADSNAGKMVERLEGLVAGE